MSDGQMYIDPARNLAAGRGFIAPDPVWYTVRVPPKWIRTVDAPDTIRTPGYPLVIAAVLALGLPLPVTIALQHLLAVITAIAIFLVTERMTGRWRAGLAAQILFSLTPAVRIFAHQYMSDILEAAVVLATILAVMLAARGSMIWAAVAGLLSGYATLVRPIALFWFLPLALILAWRARRAAAVFLAAALVLPGGWMLRNYGATGVATISSIGGENLLFYRAAAVLVIHDSPPGFGFFALQRQTGFYHRQERWKAPLAGRAFDAMRRDGIEPGTAPHALIARYYARTATPILLHHPGEVLELAFSALVEMFLGAYIPHGVPGMGLGIFVLVCVGVGLNGLDPLPRALLAATLVYFALMAAGAEAEQRFALPFAPAYAIAFGAGVDRMLAAARARRAGNAGPS